MNTSVSQPLVSIVTPVYNEAPHISECIESVLAQTYQNWEYTIVDNLSTDGTFEIASRYGATDQRIRVCRNDTFLRAIANHNAALRQISPASKYCKIVFGDDWIFPECVERMVAVVEEYPSVGVVGAYILEGSQVTCVGLPYPSKRVSGREICRREFLDRLYVWGSANSVLYRSDLVRDRDPFFNEANIHADTESCLVLLKEWDFGFVHQVLTYTRVRPDSLNAAATDIQTDMAGMLYHLQTYGPDCLTHKELTRRLKQHVSAYYAFLGKSAILGRNRAFWDFHKTKLKESGVGFSMARVLGGVMVTLWNAVLNPGLAIDKVLNRRNRPAAKQSGRFAKHQEEFR